MRIEILGPGCLNCERLASRVEQVIGELGLAAAVEKVDDWDKMAGCQMLATPGLAIDGKLVCAGRVPDEQQIRQWLAKWRVSAEGGPLADDGSFGPLDQVER